MGDNPVICGKLSCPPPRIHIRCQSVIGCIHLHGQKRGMAEEKWGLSTSRTGIPLQRHKTVHLRHLTECFPKSLHEARPRSKATKKKRKASIPPSAQRMLTTHASKKDLCKMDLQGFRQDDYSVAANLVNSFQHLLKSCDADWQLEFSPLPHLLSQTDSLLQMVQQLKCLPTTHTHANAPTVRSSWFLSPKARSRYKQPLW